MKKFIITLLITMTSLSVLAHTGITSTIPKDNAMLMKSPETIAVTFGDEVRLVNLSILNSKNEKVDFEFTPSMEASNTFSFDLPQLMPSTYKASWTIMGVDGHKMKGDFSFMVHAAGNMKEMKHKKMDHNDHNNH